MKPVGYGPAAPSSPTPHSAAPLSASHFSVAAEARAVRRDALLLAASFAVGSASASIIIGTSSLAAGALLGDNQSLATLPVSLFVFGIAIGTIPAGRLSRRWGRKPAFLLANLVGAAAGLTAAAAIFWGSFAVFCTAILVIGTAAAFHHQYRFAATDRASVDFRPRAVAWVLAGGVVAGVIGPQTAIATRDLFPSAVFSGTYAALAGLLLAALVVLSQTRLSAAPTSEKTPEPASAQSAQSAQSAPAMRRALHLPQRHWLAVALVCGPASYAMMSLVMTAAPLAMQHFGHSHTDSALAIQWHVIAMFAPSFFTGELVRKFGAAWMMIAGFFLIALAAVLGLADQSVGSFWACLIALGLGWNFAFVSATILVSGACQANTVMQSYNDFLVFGTAGGASFLSGLLLHVVGWQTLNLLVFPVSAFCILLILFLCFSGRNAVETSVKSA